MPIKKKKIYPRRTSVGQRKIDSGYKEWRRQVLERDQYTCLLCGSKKKLRCHHLRKYANSAGLRNAVKNGCTLCNSCHIKITGKESMYLAMFTRKVAENTRRLKEENKGEENEVNKTDG
jgi:5-methylcytosine-specific restriction endonuclease McrA